VKKNWGSVDVSYSFYRVGNNSVALNKLDDHEEMTLGIANHKLAINGSYYLDDLTTLNVNGTVLGPRYACVTDPVFLTCGTPQKIDTEYDFNIIVNHDIANMSLSGGIANIFDTDVNYIQAYRGGVTPVPGLGRRLTFKLSYKF